MNKLGKYASLVFLEGGVKDIRAAVHNYLVRNSLIDQKGKYRARIEHIGNDKIVEWLCFPRHQHAGYLVNGALVTDPQGIKRITDNDYVLEARAPITHIITTTHVPPRWRDLKGVYEGHQAYPLLRAMISDGPCFPFTINAAHDLIENRARRSTFLDYMRRRVRFHLHQALGRHPEFFAVVGLECKGGDRNHVHGSLAIADQELPLALDALRKAANNFDRWSVDLLLEKGHHRDPYADEGRGWAKYCRENLQEAQGKVEGILLTCTNGLRLKARKLYEQQRRSFLNREGEWPGIKATPLSL
jgi:hypothetical protein